MGISQKWGHVLYGLCLAGVSEHRVQGPSTCKAWQGLAPLSGEGCSTCGWNPFCFVCPAVSGHSGCFHFGCCEHRWAVFAVDIFGKQEGLPGGEVGEVIRRGCWSPRSGPEAVGSHPQPTHSQTPFPCCLPSSLRCGLGREEPSELLPGHRAAFVAVNNGPQAF